MITKRAAWIAIFSGVIAKMAHADDPNWAGYAAHNTALVYALNGPARWTVNLDKMTHLEVRLGGETVSIPAAELFAALRG